MVTVRHKIFISYHHGDDQAYADKLTSFYKKAIIDKSMKEDFSYLTNETILRKIRFDHLMNSTVTVVLVGVNTWGRKWIDWEINSSLRGYGDRTINGLVGVYLPVHSGRPFRLTDNIISGYAVRIQWKDVGSDFVNAVHNAWNRRKYRPDLIDNSRISRLHNAPLR